MDMADGVGMASEKWGSMPIFGRCSWHSIGQLLICLVRTVQPTAGRYRKPSPLEFVMSKGSEQMESLKNTAVVPYLGSSRWLLHQPLLSSSISHLLQYSTT